MNEINMDKILGPIFSSDLLFDITQEINKSSKKNINISGLEDIAKSYLVAALKKKLDKPIIFISYSEPQAKKIYNDLRFFFGDKNSSEQKKIFYYPVKDFICYMADSKEIDIYINRFETINYLLNKQDCLIILSAQVLFERLSEPDYFKKAFIKINLYDEIGIKDLEKKLFFLGYKKSSVARYPGQFCVHGGILDLCDNKNAFRLEFFGDQIESIRVFDIDSQLTQKNDLKKINIMPMREIVFDQDKFNKVREDIKNKFEENNRHDFFDLEKKFLDNKISRYLNFFCDKDICLLDYLDYDNLIFFDEPNKIFDSINKFYLDFIDQVQEQINLNNMILDQKNLILKPEVLFNKLNKFRSINLKTFSEETDFNIKTRTPESFKIYSDLFLDNLKSNWLNKKIIFIVCDSEQTKKNLIRYFVNKSIPVEDLDCAKEFINNKVYITSGNISSSFEFLDLNIIVIFNGVYNNFVLNKNKKLAKKNTKLIDNFLDLKINDYIVHEKHGVGIYKGIEKITTDGYTEDYLKIEYADGGILFVKTTQMTLVQKYIGSEKVKVNKLGGCEWQKSKLRAKEEVKKIAIDLINLYAKRQNIPGFKFSKDTVWQSEFENLFLYQETSDQLAAIKDIKKDMESDKVMDRLICGDVGYGKTEVAMRAAFKAVQDNKQVVYLVPTTILAQQHYNNFLDRFKDFPVNIEMLSRFRSISQQKKIIKNIASGLIDIIIGTHKLLSNKIKFKDLGLIIIDEEQRFGVAHKERLKNMRENIDVLTLSATPIPRTLSMSLSGIRDISLLTEPPSQRQPVETYVLEYNANIIKNAIKKELDRNGQVYYLYNRIKNIAEFTYGLKKLIPEANINYVHGQLLEHELENIMQNFIFGKIDILVCTTIIEAGLDIPNVNTIIINDADKIGLSQLYQLRGRVGRSDKIAYAYLTYKKDKILNEMSKQRLKTIQEFTEFGAGFKIAMKDLEIRGAGNLLGPQQHGNIDAIGYDLYYKLLNHEIKKLKNSGQEPNNYNYKLNLENEFETSIDLNIDAYIPDSYISDEKLKLDIYKKISFISNREDYFDIQKELEDRFGALPKQLENLLDIALIKSLAQKLRITSITQKNNDLVININNDSGLSIQKLLELIKLDKNLDFKTNPVPKIIYKNFSVNKKLKLLQEILSQLA